MGRRVSIKVVVRVVIKISNQNENDGGSVGDEWADQVQSTNEVETCSTSTTGLLSSLLSGLTGTLPFLFRA